MRRVLISGARAPVALDLARSFAAADWAVHLGDSVTTLGALGVGAQRHRWPAPRQRFAAFRAALAQLVDRVTPDLIVPTCEEVFALRAAAEQLGFAERVFAPPLALLARLHSKITFPQLIAELGLPAPQTRALASANDLKRVSNAAATLVFKPEFSRFATAALIRPEPPRLATLKPSPQRRWAAQDFIAGEEVCLWAAARAGQLVAFCAYRPRYRLGQSASFYFDPDPDPALYAFAAAVVGRLSVTGQLAFDVIRTRDGTIMPLECNPRAVSGVHLFGTGPALALALSGDGPAVPAPQTPAHLGPAMALFAAGPALRTGRWDSFRADLSRSRDVYGGPFGGLRAAAALLDAGQFALRGLARGCGPTAATTADIEWNGEAFA